MTEKPTRLISIKRRYSQDDGLPKSIMVTLSIDGRVRNFMTGPTTAKRAVELAYFFWTGNRVDWDQASTPIAGAIFSNTPADPMDFEDLNQVPFWSMP